MCLHYARIVTICYFTVTCVQFNPIDENCFISGCIDGKLRIWGVVHNRVVDWTDIRDVISAVCYQPDGQGFIVGSITGSCRFYSCRSKQELNLNAQVHFHDRITGIQFSQEKPERVMITSEDSKIRILQGVDVICKFKGMSISKTFFFVWLLNYVVANIYNVTGLAKSGSQMSACFTTGEKHIILVGEDSRVYIWNYQNGSSKHAVRSCEHFFAKGVSVAVQWPEQNGRGHWNRGDAERFSIGNWLSIDGSCRGSATWPEEKLSLWDMSIAEGEDEACEGNLWDLTYVSEAWSVGIVTAGRDGMIRTFHNYGLPVRL